MKKAPWFLYLFFISVVTYCQNSKPEISIIPEPVTVIKNAGIFSLPDNVIIEAGSQSEMKQVLAFLRDKFSVPTGARITISNTAPNAIIRLTLNKTIDPLIGKEGYHLSVTAKKYFNCR
jgi:hexosaminidase